MVRDIPHRARTSADDLEETHVAPRVARRFTCGFLALIAIVPVLQFLTVLDPPSQSITGLLRMAANRLLCGSRAEAASTLAPLADASFYRGYESEVVDRSWVRRLVRPKLQAVLSAVFNTGSDQVIIGRDGWLFYGPGIRYVAGPSIDARPAAALRRMNEDCRRLGIHLVVVPVPDKATQQPEQLTRRASRGHPPPNNRGYADFIWSLRDMGVDVVDLIAEGGRGSAPRYLRQDTHWTPEHMREVAVYLAQHLRSRLNLPETGATGPAFGTNTVTAIGDLARMLMGSQTGCMASPQTVMTHPILLPENGSPTARDILLLGDSFINIYSDPSLGWGSGAGLSEQLSEALQRPVAALAVNGGGALVARQSLLRDPGLLAGKRALVYVFAARELSLGDWQVLPLPDSDAVARAARRDRPASGSGQPAGEAASATIVGCVTRTSRMPEPFTAPYSECLRCLEVRVLDVLQGDIRGTNVLVLLQAMEQNRWLEGARYRAGDVLNMELTLDAEPRLQRMQVADDIENYTLEPYYVTRSTRMALTAVPTANAVLRRPAGETVAAEAARSVPVGRSTEVQMARSMAMSRTSNAIDEERRRFGDGDWQAWQARLEPWRSELRERVSRLRPVSPQAEGPFEGRGTMLPLLGTPIAFECVPDIYIPYLLESPSPTNASAELAATLSLVSAWFRKQGVDFIMVPVPKMSEVYADRLCGTPLPGSIPAPHLRSRMQELLAADVEVIDLFPLLLREKAKHARCIYLVDDPHWDQPAIKVAVQEIAQRLRRYDWVYRPEAARPLFRAMTNEVTFTGAGFAAVPRESINAVKGLQQLALTAVVPTCPGIAPSMPDAPFIVMGDSYTRYQDSILPNSDLCSLLALEMDVPICSLGRFNARIWDALRLFLRSPGLLRDRRAVVYVTCQTTFADRSFARMPDELRKAIMTEGDDLRPQPPACPGSITFGKKGNCRPFLLDGWMLGETNAWMCVDKGLRRSILNIPLPVAEASSELRLHVAVDGAQGRQRVDVSANGTRVCTWLISPAAGTYEAIIPPTVLDRTGNLLLEFGIPDARSPYEYSGGKDRNRVAVAVLLRALSLHPPPPTPPDHARAGAQNEAVE